MTVGGVLSPWVVVPITAALMGLVVLYQGWLARSDMPRWRRRLRGANGWIMLLGLPAVGAGFSIINHASNPVLFVGVWGFGLLMVAAAVGLAVVDWSASALLGLEARAAMRRTMHNPRHEPNPGHDARDGSEPTRAGKRSR